ncbi:MAG TPA: phage holin family protein [Candidatus Binatia bacterium]|nr:phage holin family protein [Candidatus Binatia bacterium]
MPNASHPSAEPSLAALIGGIINDARDLMLQEFTMAKLEVQDELRRTKAAAISLGIGIGIAAVGGLLLLLMLVHLLHALTPIPLWGCYGIVGGVLLLTGLLLLYSGKKTAEEIAVVPETVETLKENAKWIREQTTSNGV